jgi:hypothetical protein
MGMAQEIHEGQIPQWKKQTNKQTKEKLDWPLPKEVHNPLFPCLLKIEFWI